MRTSIARHVRPLVLALLALGAAGIAVGCGPSRENVKVTDEELMGGKKQGDFALKVQDGDAAWADRLEKAKLEKAIATWEEALTLQPQGDDAAQRKALYDVHVKIARAYYLLADGHVRFEVEDPDESEEMQKLYDKGVIAAEKALYIQSPEYKKAIDKETPREEAIDLLTKDAFPAMYWYATNLGKWALIEGIAESLGHVDTIKKMIERIKSDQPSFFYYAPYRYLGGYYTKLPFPGGDAEKSKKNFTTAIEKAPNYLGSRVLYAQMYAIGEDDEALFKEQLQIVLDTPADVDPAIAPENTIEKKKAKLLMDNIDEHF